MKRIKSVLHDNLCPLGISFGIFVSSFLLGFFIIQNTSVMPNLMRGSKESFLVVTNQNVFLMIIGNNLYAIFLLISGVFLLGFTTFTNLLFNGYTFGAVISTALQNGASITNLLGSTLPHCVFEIPAIIIAGAAGFKVPVLLANFIRGKNKSFIGLDDIKQIGSLTIIALVLVIIAAIIESTITIPYALTL